MERRSCPEIFALSSGIFFHAKAYHYHKQVSIFRVSRQYVLSRRSKSPLHGVLRVSGICILYREEAAALCIDVVVRDVGFTKLVKLQLLNRSSIPGSASQTDIAAVIFYMNEGACFVNASLVPQS